MPLRLDKFAEGLARDVDVTKQFAASFLPAGNPAFQHAYIGVAQVDQAVGCPLCLAGAAIEDDDRYATPGQRCQGLGFKPREGEVCCEQGVSLRMCIFLAHIQQGDFLTGEQRGPDVEKAGKSGGESHGNKLHEGVAGLAYG